MSIWEAVSLGIVQGLTEFLPVSSSGHLLIVRSLLGAPLGEAGLKLDVAVHLGTLVAIMIYFRREVLSILAALPHWASAPFGGRRSAERAREIRLIWLLLTGTAVTGIIGILFRDVVAAIEVRSALPVVASLLAANGAFLVAGDLMCRGGRELHEMNYRWGALVGLAQGVAVLPGISRSGATITAGMLTGAKREAAARFSFLLAIPAIMGASALELGGRGRLPGGFPLLPAVTAAIVAAATGLVGIYLLLILLRARRLWGFGVYCIAFATVVLALGMLT